MLDKKQTGRAVGALFGLCHLLWVFALALGFAEGILRFTLEKHFVSGVTLLPFNFAVGLIGGFVIGWVFAWLYNCMEVKKSQV